MTPAQLIATRVLPPLHDLGFQGKGVLTLVLTGSAIGWLGLNRASRHFSPGQFGINPVVGVRHQAVERLIAECRGERFHPSVPPTLSVPLGYLLPESRYRLWTFDEQVADDAARDMAAAVQEYGLPFMRRNTDIEALCRSLEDARGFPEQLAYRRPAAYWLAGKYDEALESLERSLVDLGPRDDPAAIELRRFSRAFHQLQRSTES
jgi:hypothetical protein